MQFSAISDDIYMDIMGAIKLGKLEIHLSPQQRQQLVARPVPANPSGRQPLPRLATVIEKLSDCLDLFGSEPAHQRLAGKISQLRARLMAAPPPEDFFNNPHLAPLLGQIDLASAKYCEGQPLNRRELQLLDNMASNLLAASKTTSSSQTISLQAALRSRLLRNGGLAPSEIDQAISQLEFWQTTAPRIYQAYLRRFQKTPSVRETAGLLAELAYSVQLARNPNYEILHTGLEITDGPLEIELFDIIAKEKISGKVIFVEVKRDFRFSLGELLYQFFGILKPIGQIDPLLAPRRFRNLPAEITQAIETANFEIHFVTPRIDSGFARLGLYAPIGRRLISLIRLLVNNPALAGFPFEVSKGGVVIDSPTFNNVTRGMGKLARVASLPIAEVRLFWKTLPANLI